MNDPEMIYFCHCDKSNQILCLEVPEKCPICHESIDDGNDDSETVAFEVRPTTLRCPFVPASKAPCAIPIRPTNGDFLHHYRNSTDLHIGVTNSIGIVFDFNHNGIKESNPDSSKWSQAIAISVTTEASKRWIEHWDYTLTITAKMDVWSASDYDSDSFNCYSFVLTFLKMLNDRKLKPSLTSKQQFCSDFVVPQTIIAAKYISLYRQVIREGISVFNVKKETIDTMDDQADSSTSLRNQDVGYSSTNRLTSTTDDKANDVDNDDDVHIFI